MRFLARAIAQLSTNSRTTQIKGVTNLVAHNFLSSNRSLSTKGGNEGDIDWGSESTWSSGLTKEHFDGEVVGQKVGENDGTISGGISDGVGGGGALGSPSFASASQTDDDYERGEGQTYVMLTVKTEGVVAIPNGKEPEMVFYNIVCDELMLGIPHKAWWVVILAVVCLGMAFVIPSFLPPLLQIEPEE